MINIENIVKILILDAFINSIIETKKKKNLNIIDYWKYCSNIVNRKVSKKRYYKNYIELINKLYIDKILTIKSYGKIIAEYEQTIFR